MNCQKSVELDNIRFPNICIYVGCFYRVEEINTAFLEANQILNNCFELNPGRTD